MKIYIWFGVGSDILPVLAALYFYRRLDFTLKLVAVFLLLSTLSDAIESLMVFLGLHNNCPVVHIYLLISALFFGVTYYHAFFNLLVKKIVAVLTGIVLLAMVFNSIFIEKIMEYPSISNTVLSVLLIFFSLMYFYQLLTRQQFIHIEKQSFFWINMAVLFYYSATIFLFMLFKKLSVEQNGSFFIINSIANIIANILFTVGLLCKPENAKEQLKFR